VELITPAVRTQSQIDHYALESLVATSNTAGVILYEMLAGTTPFPRDNPFTIMHNRLVNHPIPPREIDPSISAELQKIIYRALERDLKNRYARADEFSWDVQHQDEVGVADQSELRKWRRRAPWTGAALFYVLMAIIPLIIFAFLLFVARRR
jgi:serine/threonine-protein kinase